MHPSELAPDSIVGGRYRIRRVLGRGGMGIVYEAEHTSLHRVVALKMLIGEAATNVQAALRFFQEARAAASIGHPGIIEIFDLSQPGEPPFLVMEKLEGEELGKLLLRGVMDSGTVVAIGAELCDAVGAAHRHAIVHRDLKPDNVFLARRVDRQAVKVLDFGIAKLVGSDVHLTQTGQLIGTPLYMSPEQMRGGEVDARTDVYSIGAILFECLSGRPPFLASSMTEIVFKVTTEKAPLVRSIRSDVPSALAALIESCLEKEPEKRPRDANILASALRELPRSVAATLASPASPETRPVARAAASPTQSKAAARPSFLAIAIGVGACLLLGALALAAIGWASGFSRATERPPVVQQHPPPATDAGSASPEDYQVRWERIAQLVNRGEQGEARRELQELLRRYPGDQQAHELLEQLDAERPRGPDHPPSRDPFSRPLPDRLAFFHRRVVNGQELSASEVRELRDFARTHSEEAATVHLLLAHAFMHDRPVSLRVMPEYEAAMEIDPTVRGDPHMLPELLTLARSEQLHRRAADCIEDWYGTEAVSAIDAMLAQGVPQTDADRLRRLRQRIVDSR